MPTKDVDSELTGLLNVLTNEELLAYRAEVIDNAVLTRFPALFSVSTPHSWVQLPQLQQWLIQRAHIPKLGASTRLTTPKVKTEHQSENDVLDITTPTRPIRSKRRGPLAEAAQDVIVISSDSEDEPPRKRIKNCELTVTVKQESVKKEDVFSELAGGQVQITRQLRVARVEWITEMPRCWAMLEERIAYVLDLSADDRDWLDADGELIAMDRVIREEDQDNWGGSGSHRTDELKCPRVAVLGGQRCRHVVLKCQGCYVCDHLDPDLLRDCVRREYDGDQMRHVWEAERKINEAQGGSIKNITAVFYNQIQQDICSYQGVECDGRPVMRAWRKGGKNLDGKTHFIGCSAWKKEDPERMHRFIPIPYNVDQDALLMMIQNHGFLVDDDGPENKCALVVPRRIGGKMKRCPYPHSENGEVVTGEMVIRNCPAALDAFVPLDDNVHQVCVVPRQRAHNHPAYPERKLSSQAKRKYVEAVETFGALGATVGKVDKAASTSKILDGKSPRKFHPGLGQRRTKQRIIKKLKDKDAPEGFGLPGVIARKEQQKELPSEKQYIHRIVDSAGLQMVVTMLPRLAAKMHTVRASLHDNTYKRTFGKWKEWEVVIWDDCLDTRITVSRIYCDSENTDAFEHIWTAFFEVLQEVTGKPLKLQAFHKEGNYLAVLVDGDAGQVIGLGKWLQRQNNPDVSGIHETDPAVLVQYLVKTCWTHCRKNLDILATHLDNPDDVKYIQSFEHMETDNAIEEFREWCRTHSSKAVRDWYENKVRHRWYLPSLNPHLSRIRRDHWALVPKNTNCGESAHAHTNFYTGIGHTLLSAIDAAYKYDLQREEEIMLAEEHCLLQNSRNTLAHRMQNNAIRASARAQSAHERAADAEKAQELEELKASLAAELESRRPHRRLSTEERSASLQRSRQLQDRMDGLRQEGVSLKRGRKRKTTSTPLNPLSSSLPVPAPALLPFDPTQQEAFMPPSFSLDMPLDADLDPSNFAWTNTPSDGALGFDFEMDGLDGQFRGVDVDLGEHHLGLDGVGPSRFAGSLDWSGLGEF